MKWTALAAALFALPVSNAGGAVPACTAALAQQARDRAVREKGGIPDRDENARRITAACAPGAPITLKPPAAFYVEQLCDLAKPVIGRPDGSTVCTLRR
jgi:hypothetical protein